MSPCGQFFMHHQRWELALGCLDVVLRLPSDEDSPWIPDTESLLMRSELRLLTGNKKGEEAGHGMNLGKCYFIQGHLKMLSSFHREVMRLWGEFHEPWF